MDHAIEILLAVNTGLISLGLWFLYKIMSDVNSMKVTIGIAKVRIHNIDYRLQKVEGMK